MTRFKDLKFFTLAMLLCSFLTASSFTSCREQKEKEKTEEHEIHSESDEHPEGEEHPVKEGEEHPEGQEHPTDSVSG
ncbi:MAG: hypothetical protein ACKVJF_13320 [Flavobacteriales bacterium]